MAKRERELFLVCQPTKGGNALHQEEALLKHARVQDLARLGLKMEGRNGNQRGKGNGNGTNIIKDY